MRVWPLTECLIAVLRRNSAQLAKGKPFNIIAFALSRVEDRKGGRDREKAMSSIGSVVRERAGPILGAVFIVILLTVFAGLGILSSTTSAGIASAITQFDDMMAVIGIASVFGLVLLVLNKLGG